MKTIYDVVKFFCLDGIWEEVRLADGVSLAEATDTIEKSETNTESEIDSFIGKYGDLRKSECYARYELYPTHI